jgi:hypothetical protein
VWGSNTEKHRKKFSHFYGNLYGKRNKKKRTQNLKKGGKECLVF